MKALVRWQHPTEGLLARRTFCRWPKTAAAWRPSTGKFLLPPARPLPPQTDFTGYLGLNVAPRHFRNPHFCQQLLDMLKAAGLSPSRLCLEITEGALIDDPERTCDLLNELRSHGMSLALDDFGTGYSSLGYLHRFPLLTLKIDRSFRRPAHRPHRQPGQRQRRRGARRGGAGGLAGAERGGRRHRNPGTGRCAVRPGLPPRPRLLVCQTRAIACFFGLIPLGSKSPLTLLLRLAVHYHSAGFFVNLARAEVSKPSTGSS